MVLSRSEPLSKYSFEPIRCCLLRLGRTCSDASSSRFWAVRRQRGVHASNNSRPIEIRVASNVSGLGWAIAIQLGAIYKAQSIKREPPCEAALSISTLQYLDFEVVEVDPFIPLVFDPVVWPGA